MIESQTNGLMYLILILEYALIPISHGLKLISQLYGLVTLSIIYS